MQTLARTILLLVCLLTTAGVSLAYGATQETGFLNRTITVEGAPYRYVVYLPQGYAAQPPAGERGWPVILFLHGAGERGSDGLAQTDVGLPSAVRLHPERWPFVIVMPQLPWDHHYWTDEAMGRMAMATLEAASEEFHGDPDRTYLTGLSLGGFGTWRIGAERRERFAAIAPVCGGVRWPLWSGNPPRPALYDDEARALGRMPTWIFHGSVDPVVPADESRLMYEALERTGGDVRFTEFGGVAHASWVPAYDTPELPQWLLAQRLSRRQQLQPSARFTFVPPTPAPAKVDPHLYDAYAGTYTYEPGNSLVVTREYDHLYGQFTHRARIELFPENETTFFTATGGDRWIFVRDARGRVDQVVEHGDRHDAHWPRTEPGRLAP